MKNETKKVAFIMRLSLILIAFFYHGQGGGQNIFCTVEGGGSIDCTCQVVRFLTNLLAIPSLHTYTVVIICHYIARLTIKGVCNTCFFNKVSG